MPFLIELYRLTRFDHAIMLAIAVLIGETIVLGSAPTITTIVVLSLLVPMLSEAGSFALNDYLDIASDRINKKFDRPLVAGTISPSFAFYFSILCIFLSVILAYFINIFAFLIALVFNGLAILYNWKLKDLPLLGNAYIALSMSIPFVFGNVAVAQVLSPLVLVLASLGFVSGLAREILKSVQDMEGDIIARKSRTLPIVIGAKPSLLIASVLYFSFIIISFVPFSVGLSLTFFSIGGIAGADLLIAYIIYLLFIHGPDKQVLKDARNISLAALFIGMIGILIAAI